MPTYLINFKRKRSRGDKLIELSSLERLIEWIKENATRCRWVHITVVEDR